LLIKKLLIKIIAIITFFEWERMWQNIYAFQGFQILKTSTKVIVVELYERVLIDDVDCCGSQQKQ